MNRKTGWIIGGCLSLALIMVLALVFGGVLALNYFRTTQVTEAPAPTRTPWGGVAPENRTPLVKPTFTPAGPPAAAPQAASGAGPSSEALGTLYEALNPGVVNIGVTTATGGSTGSGFLIDNQGHIVTNNHVVDGATSVVVAFYDGYEVEAKIVGLDDDSDIAVIKVDEIPSNARVVSLGDSDQVSVGEWVIAIGSPFGLGSTMTLGIVSARGRTIPSGVTPFSIPEAIQTDAAINPGNSGGPLINMRGEVIGVNAQIASGGVAANAGVGFSIPINVVRKVAPVLIEQGFYDWPWLGVSGGSVNLLLQQANRLDSQYGAYISAVADGGPASDAGVRGSSGTVDVNGQQIPVGGDVIVAVDGAEVAHFEELLSKIAFRDVGDEVTVTVVREGRQIELKVNLEARPQSFGE